jgi:hypothetical protein
MTHEDISNNSHPKNIKRKETKIMKNQSKYAYK